MKRAINIEFKDGSGKELEIGKVLEMKKGNQLNRIYLEEMLDGKWRLLYTDDLIPDFTQVTNFNIIREDD